MPFAAVAAANCVNIPMMRQQEIMSGITVRDADGKELGKSKVSFVLINSGLLGSVSCQSGTCMWEKVIRVYELHTQVGSRPS